MNPSIVSILQEVVRRESCSLLLYIGDAYPWTTTQQAPDLVTVRRLVASESAAVTSLGRYLVRQRITPPATGSYPASFTSCNFIDLAYLLPRLIAAQDTLIATLTADIHKLSDEEARKQLEALLATKQATLAGLKQVQALRTQPVSA